MAAVVAGGREARVVIDNELAVEVRQIARQHGGRSGRVRPACTGSAAADQQHRGGRQLGKRAAGRMVRIATMRSRHDASLPPVTVGARRAGNLSYVAEQAERFDHFRREIGM
jgi:hypothetical protein